MNYSNWKEVIWMPDNDFVRIDETGDEVPEADVYHGEDSTVYYDADGDQHTVAR